MRLQLGCLFAAGHSPQTIGDLTWPQVMLMVEGIQMYHLDLASRLVSGKSHFLEADEQLADLPDAPDDDEARKELLKLKQIEQFAQMSASTGALEVQILNRPEIDGFKLTKWLSEVPVVNRPAAMAAAMAGEIDLDQPVPERFKTST